jgi:amino acid permease
LRYCCNHYYYKNLYKKDLQLLKRGNYKTKGCKRYNVFQLVSVRIVIIIDIIIIVIIIMAIIWEHIFYYDALCYILFIFYFIYKIYIKENGIERKHYSRSYSEINVTWSHK